MTAMVALPDDHPLIKAWDAHKQTDEYANSKKWAAYDQHLDGSLWALFSAGWRAAKDDERRHPDPLDEALNSGDGTYRP